MENNFCLSLLYFNLSSFLFVFSILSFFLSLFLSFFLFLSFYISLTLANRLLYFYFGFTFIFPFKFCLFSFFCGENSILQQEFYLQCAILPNKLDNSDQNQHTHKPIRSWDIFLTNNNTT